MDFLLVIPARMHSSRLPGKPLIKLNGKSMLQRTYEQSAKVMDSANIVVATDHVEIEQHCCENGMNVVMTSPDHLTGTDRVAEVAEHYKADMYINVQGDEPVINPDDIKQVIEEAAKQDGALVNGYASIANEYMYKSFTVPKVVFRNDGRLLYMSRAPIPGNKQGQFQCSWRQICIYAFPHQALQAFAKQNGKTRLEGEEDIEILRFLELGYEVQMVELSGESLAVDTQEDVEKVKRVLNES